MHTSSEDTSHRIDGKNFPLLAILYPDELHYLQSVATTLAIAPDVSVIQEGHTNQYLYLVQSGVLRVSKQHDDFVFEIGSITPGELFGEASILYNTPAAANVRSVEPCALYQIEASHLQEIIQTNSRFNHAIHQLSDRRSAAGALAINPMFSTLPQAVREIILYNSEIITIEAGETLVQEGSHHTEFMYLILTGEAEASIQQHRHKEKKLVFARLSSGDEVGEISIVTEKPHAATVIATSPVRLLMINTQSIQAWRNRYSDFNHALRNRVQIKLQHSLAALRQNE